MVNGFAYVLYLYVPTTSILFLFIVKSLILAIYFGNLFSYAKLN